MQPFFTNFTNSIKNDCGQVSLEAILVISALLIFFSTIVFITVDKEIFILESEEQLSKSALCYKIANGIISTYSIGENVSMVLSFNIPNDVKFGGENITILNGGLIHIGEIGSVSAYDCEIPRGVVNNSFIRLPGTVRIWKYNNMVFIENV
ncbi:MAG: hypothetical protein QXY62_02895 [Candidatus Altiarchaeota archaeon]